MNASPTWQEVELTIPPCFLHRSEMEPPYPPANHNGASSPFRWLYPIIYDDQTILDIAGGSYIHDSGFSIFQLPGSPWAHLTQKQWDDLYRDYLLDHGHPNVAKLHHMGVRWKGHKAFAENKHILLHLYGDWEHYLKAKDCWPWPPVALV